MRELSRQPGEVVKGLRRSKAADTIVTHRGRPVARLTPLSEDEYEDYLLGRLAAAVDLKRQRATLRPLAEVMRDLKVSHGRQPRQRRSR